MDRVKKDGSQKKTPPKIRRGGTEKRKSYLECHNTHSGRFKGQKRNESHNCQIGEAKRKVIKKKGTWLMGEKKEKILNKETKEEIKYRYKG